MSDHCTIDHEFHGEWSTDRLIAGLAEESNGRVRRGQLLAAGVGRGAIDYRVAQGTLIVLARGIYAVGHAAPSQDGDWSAAVLMGGDGAVLGAWHAAALLGHVRVAGPPIDVIVPAYRRPRDGYRFRRQAICHDEILECRDIRATSTVRTFRDIAAQVEADRLNRMIDLADNAIRYDPITFAELFSRYPRHPGCRALKQLFRDRAEGKGRSWLERRFNPIIRGLPIKPERNKRVPLHDGRTIEADCLFGRLLIELDGRTYHERHAAFEWDRSRDRAAIVSGYIPMRLTWMQLRDEPGRIRADIAAVLEDLSPRLGPFAG
jgi:hypothetical protein